MRLLYGSTSYPPFVSGTSIIAERVAAWMSHVHEVSICCPSETRHFSKRITETGIEYRLPSIPMPLKQGYRVAVPNPRLLKHIFSTIRPDAVHLYDPSPMNLLLTRYASRRNIPVVYSHFFIPQFIFSHLPLSRLFSSNWLKRPLDAVTLKLIMGLYHTPSTIVVLTDFMKNFLTPFTFVPIRTISGGVDLSRFHNISRKDAERLFEKYHLQKRPTVLYVGRLDYDKNLNTLLDAWNIFVRMGHNDFQLLLVGNGIMRQKLTKSAKKMGIDQSVTFSGTIPHDNLPAIYKNPWVKIFLISSAVETQSLATLEALAAGLPVVAARSAALPELVKHRHNGFLVDPYDSKRFAQSLHVLIQDEWLRQQLSSRASSSVKDHSFEQSEQKYLKLYHDLVASPAAGNQRSSAILQE